MLQMDEENWTVRDCPNLVENCSEFYNFFSVLSSVDYQSENPKL